MNRLAAGLLIVAAVGRQDPPRFEDRFVYVQMNLWVDKNLDTLEDVMRRAAKAGYTGVVLADSKFGKLGDMDARYFRNVDRVKKLAGGLKLEIVPCVFPVGYSESILWHDPNLAEAIPVVDAPFVVKDGEARPGAEGGALERWEWKDEIVSDSLEATDPDGRNARVVFKVPTAPHRAYVVAAKIRTTAFQGEPEIKAIAGGKVLNFQSLGAKATQDWTEHRIVFNSLEHEEVRLYFGCWNGRKGTLAWKDLSWGPAGLLNVVRRDGAPLVVKEGDRELVEGRDFERVEDPKTGRVPWPGGYEVWHEPPPIRTKLADGTRLSVSYHHAVTIHDGQVMICPSEPKTVELLRDQARRMHEAWGARSYFMSHDEIRVLNRDASCTKRGLDAGAILADHVKTCVSFLKEVNPGGRIFVWSDMFDPHHNARKDYYLVRGDLAGSWEGLGKDVIVAAWNRQTRAKSLEWFTGRGHRVLIAGYYDAPVEQVSGWLEAAAGVKGVGGVMYTTWRGDYTKLEPFAEAVRAGR